MINKDRLYLKGLVKLRKRSKGELLILRTALEEVVRSCQATNDERWLRRPMEDRLSVEEQLSSINTVLGEKTEEHTVITCQFAELGAEAQSVGG